MNSRLYFQSQISRHRRSHLNYSFFFFFMIRYMHATLSSFNNSNMLGGKHFQPVKESFLHGLSLSNMSTCIESDSCLHFAHAWLFSWKLHFAADQDLQFSSLTYSTSINYWICELKECKLLTRKKVLLWCNGAR